MLDEYLSKLYEGALAATEKAIEVMESADNVVHDALAYLRTQAAELRKRLGLPEVAFGAAGDCDCEAHRSAAASFCDSLKAGS